MARELNRVLLEAELSSRLLQKRMALVPEGFPALLQIGMFERHRCRRWIQPHQNSLARPLEL